MTLREKIEKRQAKVGIIGLGYVGLPLAVEFAKAGFDVTGFDVDASKVSEINAGRSYIGDVTSADVDDNVKVTAARVHHPPTVLARSRSYCWTAFPLLLNTFQPLSTQRGTTSPGESTGCPSAPTTTFPDASRSGTGPGSAWIFRWISRPKPSE